MAGPVEGMTFHYYDAPDPYEKLGEATHLYVVRPVGEVDRDPETGEWIAKVGDAVETQVIDLRPLLQPPGLRLVPPSG